jgi:type IV fimbrial biogenesis protein FimT
LLATLNRVADTMPSLPEPHATELPARAPTRPTPAQRGRLRGLTLVELAVCIALLAVVATLALPSFANLLARHRLKAAAQALAQDLSEARFEAARRGQALHVDLHPGPGWCWTVATTPGCGCQPGPAPACRLKLVQEGDFPGVQLAHPAQFSLQPLGTVVGPLSTQLRLDNGTAVQIDLGPTGRAHLCSVGGGLASLPAC